MINLPKFDSEYYGKTFKDTGLGTTYTCVGYGDNQGNPYLVGMVKSATGIRLVTVLLKNCEFVP